MFLAGLLGLGGCVDRAPSPAGETEPLGKDAIKALIERHIPVMDAVGPQAEAKYAASLAGLRAHRRQVVELLLEGYPQVPATRHYLRWKIVFTLGELGDPLAVPFLTGVARGNGTSVTATGQKPPMVTFSKSPDKEEQKQQAMTQGAATRALAKLVDAGSGQAAKALTSLLADAPQEVVITAAIELHRRQLYPIDARARLGAISRISVKRLLDDGRPRPSGAIRVKSPKPHKHDPPPRIPAPNPGS